MLDHLHERNSSGSSGKIWTRDQVARDVYQSLAKLGKSPYYHTSKEFHKAMTRNAQSVEVFPNAIDKSIENQVRVH